MYDWNFIVLEMRQRYFSQLENVFPIVFSSCSHTYIDTTFEMTSSYKEKSNIHILNLSRKANSTKLLTGESWSTN